MTLATISFESPGWLALLPAALLVPLWIHLRGRRRLRPALFPTARFFHEAQPAWAGGRGRRLRDALRLFVRVLILTLVLLACARPVWTASEGGPLQRWLSGARDGRADDAGALTVLVVDRSASMSRLWRGERLLDAAVRRAVDRLESREAAHGRAAVVMLDEDPEPLLPEATSGTAQLVRRLLTQTPSVGRGDEVRAAEQVRRILARDAARSDGLSRSRPRVLWLSDGQATQRRAAAVARELAMAEVEYVDVGPTDEEVNLALNDPRLAGAQAGPGAGRPVVGQPTTLAVTVRNFSGAARRATVRAEIAGQADARPGAAEVSIEPWSEATAMWPVTWEQEGTHTVRFVLDGGMADAMAVDDVATLNVRVRPARAVVLVTRADVMDPTAAAHHLWRALSPSAALDGEGAMLTPTGRMTVAVRTPQAWAAQPSGDVAIFVEAGTLEPPVLDAVAGFVADGGGWVHFIDSRAAVRSTRALGDVLEARGGWNWLPLRLAEEEVAWHEGADARLTNARVGHPALRLFSGTFREDFLSHRFARTAVATLRVDEGALPLLVSDIGCLVGLMPADAINGRGAAALVAADVSPRSSDFAGTPEFVVWLHELVAGVDGGGRGAAGSEGGKAVACVDARESDLRRGGLRPEIFPAATTAAESVFQAKAMVAVVEVFRWLLGAAVLLVMMGLLRAIARMRRHGGDRLGMGMRAAVLVMLAVAMLAVTRRGGRDVEGVWVSAVDARPRLAVLVDTSASMGAPMGAGVTRWDVLRQVWLRDESVRALEAAAGVTWMAFDEGWRVVEPAEVSRQRPRGAATQLATALQGAAGLRPDAVLLLSDGRATAVSGISSGGGGGGGGGGEEAVEEMLRGDGPAVFTVGPMMGAPGLRGVSGGVSGGTSGGTSGGGSGGGGEVEVRAWCAPGTVQAGEGALLCVAVDRMGDTADAPLIVEVCDDEGERVGVWTLAAGVGSGSGDDGDGDRLTLAVRPAMSQAVGGARVRGYRAVVRSVRKDREDGGAGDVLGEAWALVRVPRRPVRVAVLEGRVNWETRFLAAALSGQRWAEVRTFYALGPERVVTRGAEAEVDAAAASPSGAGLQELERFDVVIVGGRVERLLGERAAAQLEAYVNQGGAAVAMGGAKPWAASVRGSKGRVLQLAGGERWRAALAGGGEGGKAFGPVLRWIHDVGGGGREGDVGLELDRDEVAMGEAVTVTVRALRGVERGWMPTVEAMAMGPGAGARVGAGAEADPRRIVMSEVPGEGAGAEEGRVWRGVIGADRMGMHRVVLQLPSSSEMETKEQRFAVRASRGEWADTRPAAGVLRRLSRVSGGRELGGEEEEEEGGVGALTAYLRDVAAARVGDGETTRDDGRAGAAQPLMAEVWFRVLLAGVAVGGLALTWGRGRRGEG